MECTKAAHKYCSNIQHTAGHGQYFLMQIYTHNLIIPIVNIKYIFFNRPIYAENHNVTYADGNFW